MKKRLAFLSMVLLAMGTAEFRGAPQGAEEAQPPSPPDETGGDYEPLSKGERIKGDEETPPTGQPDSEGDAEQEDAE